MKIAVHQMRSGIEPSTNIAVMVDAIHAAALAGAKMYFAPEMSVILDSNRERAAEHIKNSLVTDTLFALCDAAKSNGILVHAGSMPVFRGPGANLLNRSVVIGPDGETIGCYDKMHLFDVSLPDGESWRESKTYGSGEGPVAIATPFGLMGLCICYDLRFPDLFSAYAKSGANILAVPSAFTVPTGEAHWHILLRARAIEAEAFVVAAAQCGTHEDGRRTFGHSLVVDPWGEILLDMGQDEGVGFAELSLDRLNEVRRQIPVHANRRDISMPVKIV